MRVDFSLKHFISSRLLITRYLCLDGGFVPGRMFASSSFYAPNHPTVEEQVELARRISASLSDISNQRSKGQTMYVHRKKRSVKWVHEGKKVNDAYAISGNSPSPLT